MNPASLFSESERAQSLRRDILTRHASQLMTDDERAALFGLPAGCRIRENAKIISPENLVCGEHVWIGEGAVLDASGGLTIGEHTSIGLGVMIWSHSSRLANMALANDRPRDFIERSPTQIGKGCFIAGPAVILHGVTIGDFVTVSPMTVVSKDVPDWSVVIGNPCKIIPADRDGILRQIEEKRQALAAGEPGA